MKKVIFGFILVCITLMGCSPRNYFLFNSDMVARYDRVNGKWELVWNTSLKHLNSSPDSIPIVVIQDSASSHQ